MRYNIFLLLIIICLPGMNPAFAQDTRYRVELLVLSHISHDSDAEELNQLEDFSAAVDFLTPPPAKENEEIAGTEEPVAAEEPVTEMTELSVEQPELLPDPNALVHIEEMSDVMQESWRRLRLSGPFRPEQYLSWEQGEQEPFPTLRVHDLEVVMMDDPYAALRQELADQEQETTLVFTDPAAADSGEQPALPDPVMYHRLDGTATLRRTRFLHLDLDLQLREAVWGDTNFLPNFSTEETGEQEPRQPDAFLVHSLKQSRQVKTGRMEYFDGPVLGVLAFVTPVKAGVEE